MNTLTIATACYRSFDSVYFTLLALRAYHGRNFDILVIDNAPEACGKTAAITRACGGRYVHRPDLNGTTRPRNACFQYASTPWVMVLDDHVLLDNGAVAAAIRYADENPDSRDIISGPILGDDGRWTATHWNSNKSHNLWGSWACDQEYQQRWGAVSEGGWNPDSAKAAVNRLEPFEIPSMGLGLWMMRKAAWPWFNPHFRGFGGEEGYIHAKVRQLGGKALCHPKIRWHHKFRDVGGPHSAPPYPLNLESHVRNLLLGAKELGIQAENDIWEDFGRRLNGGQGSFDRIRADVRQTQAEGRLFRRKRVRVLGLWYSNNAAPESLLLGSLRSIDRARQESFHDVRIGSSVWTPIKGNPFPESVDKNTVAGLPGHHAILKQMKAAWRVGQPDQWEADVICFLEHDVLYPSGYFDRVADAFCDNPELKVISNLDYIGLGPSGWLKTVNRHEPMHQISMSREAARENMQRAEKDCESQGWAYLEPDHEQDRTHWRRLSPEGFAPAVHVGHQHRFTNHHEVVYEAFSTMGSNGAPLTNHPFWGEHKNWWPYQITERDDNMACGGCKKAQEAALAAAAPPPQPSPMDDLRSRHPDIPVPISEWYEAEKQMPPDFRGHMDALKELCSTVRHATEMSIWGKQAYLAIAAGMPDDGVLVSCRAGGAQWWRKMMLSLGGRFKPVNGHSLEVDIEPTELLFIDSKHTAEQTYQELQKHADKVSKYIVIHTVDKGTFGEVGDDGGPGVMPAVRRWLGEGAKSEWVVKKFYEHNHGMIVLSRDPADRPEIKFGARDVWKYLKAKTKHALNGGTFLPLPMVHERLDVCLTCEHRGGSEGGNCKICKCYLTVLPDDMTVGAGGPGKTFFPTESCPIGKWLPRPDDGVSMSGDELRTAIDALAEGAA